MSTKHKLKTWPQFFQAISSGEKTCEFRKNDRDFKVGDTLLLQEFNPNAPRYTGNSLKVVVTHVVFGNYFNIPEDYCMMSIRKL